ncbi:MAG: pyridoxine 5'-phosphate synthase [Candidatus Thioglobus sp.]|jgi:pyridoxine 5-phosphate synthase|nr:pyridoxine 5'-phosphate synthase [Candidatus Thioglobus sp.]|tara:strand:- start:403 stop:1134 length:732 start_codon:yes stop_codon:yes gene_type:complete
MSIYLGVNIDHIATLREARGTIYPSPLEAALICENSGADSITLHLREDRRHIQDSDVEEIRSSLKTKMNLEMAATDEMLRIAGQIKPQDCCLVPEKREELTTEGGLDVASQIPRMTEVCLQLNEENVRTSLFIDADKRQIDAALSCGAPVIEIHTGHYADSTTIEEQDGRYAQIKKACIYAHEQGLQVNAGHGLTIQNTRLIAEINEIVELNIGHSIVARSVFIGLANAVSEMKALMLEARGI